MHLNEITQQRPQILFVVTSFEGVSSYVSDLFAKTINVYQGYSLAQSRMSVSTKSSISDLFDRTVAQPWGSEYWLAEMHYKDIEGNLDKIRKAMLEPGAVKFLVHFNRSDYVKARDLAKEVKGELYWGENMPAGAVKYILAPFVHQKRLSEFALKYIASGFYSSPDKVIDLYRYLSQPEVSPVMSKGDVQLVVGYPAQAPEKLINALLKLYTGELKTPKTIFQNFKESSKQYKSPNSLRWKLKETIEAYLLIQELYTSGVFKLDLPVDLKAAGLFDEHWSKVGKYKRFSKDITQIPHGALMLLWSELATDWQDETDVTLFLVRWSDLCQNPVF